MEGVLYLDYYDCSKNPRFKMWLNGASLARSFFKNEEAEASSYTE